MPIEIRRAVAAECKVLRNLARSSKRYWGYSEEQLSRWTHDQSVTPELIREQLVYCAVSDGAVVGFYAVCREDAGYRMRHLWVAPAHIRRGIGTSLFRHAIATLKAMGAPKLSLACDPHAEGFYSRMGAACVGKVSSSSGAAPVPFFEIELRGRSRQ
jgi:GNAT superfamily N-acetyltransferase